MQKDLIKFDFMFKFFKKIFDMVRIVMVVKSDAELRMKMIKILF